MSTNEEIVLSWFELTLDVTKVGKRASDVPSSERWFKIIWPELANGATDNGLAKVRSQKLMQHEPEESEIREHLQFATKERRVNSKEEFKK